MRQTLATPEDLGAWSRFSGVVIEKSPSRAKERVSLLPRAEQRADRLSGGQQRVSIARALAQEPRVILADERVASLDPELAWQVMSLLSRCARDEGVPTVIAIHAVDLARAFSDRIIGVAGGEIVFDGPPGALTEQVLRRVYRGEDQETDERSAADSRRLVGVPNHGQLVISPRSGRTSPS